MNNFLRCFSACRACTSAPECSPASTMIVASVNADIVAYLKDIERRYPGLEHVMIAWALGTPRALMIEQLTRFAREVMPAFTS